MGGTGRLEERPSLGRPESLEQNTTILVVTHDQALAGKTDPRFRLVRRKIAEESARQAG